MSPPDLEPAVREVVTLLSTGEFDRLRARCPHSRASFDDLRRVMHEYGRNYIVPPPTAYRPLDAVAVTSAAVPTWSVRAPLWTVEEGRSDLTLRMTITLGSDGPRVEIDDLLVP